MSNEFIFLKLGKNVETVVININYALLTLDKTWFTPSDTFEAIMYGSPFSIF